MNLNKFLQELKRRNVFKVATAYAVTAWLLIQVVVAIEKPLSLPDKLDTIIIWVLLIGFPLALIIAWIYEWTNKGLQKTGSVDADDSITSTTGKKLNRVIITSLSVLIVFLLVERIFFVGDLFTEETPSIAVLPFENRSSDPENEYFADGLAEELLTELSQVEGLKVIARTSSFSFKGKDATLEEIADALGVDHILTGSVRKDGEQVRISAELVDTSAGTSLWNKAFERKLSAIFNVQKEIAKTAVEELYFNRRAYHAVLFDLKEDIKFLPYKETPEFIALTDKILADIHQKRAMVIDYLRAEGEWESQWDTQLD